MKMNSLQDLLVDVLKDTYDAEHQITKALPKMAEAAKHSELKQAFQQHLSQTENQIKQLEQVFQIVGSQPSRKTCKAMEGLIKEGDEIMKENMDSDVLDAALISAAQKVEHYEIAAYGTLRTYAEMLGFNDAARILDEIGNQEGETDKLLTEVARRINRAAAH